MKWDFTRLSQFFTYCSILNSLLLSLRWIVLVKVNPFPLYSIAFLSHAQQRTFWRASQVRNLMTLEPGDVSLCVGFLCFDRCAAIILICSVGISSFLDMSTLRKFTVSSPSASYFTCWILILFCLSKHYSFSTIGSVLQYLSSLLTSRCLL